MERVVIYGGVIGEMCYLTRIPLTNEDILWEEDLNFQEPIKIVIHSHEKGKGEQLKKQILDDYEFYDMYRAMYDDMNMEIKELKEKAEKWDETKGNVNELLLKENHKMLDEIAKLRIVNDLFAKNEKKLEQENKQLKEALIAESKLTSKWYEIVQKVRQKLNLHQGMLNLVDRSELTDNITKYVIEQFEEILKEKSSDTVTVQEYGILGRIQKEEK